LKTTSSLSVLCLKLFWLAREFCWLIMIGWLELVWIKWTAEGRAVMLFGCWGPEDAFMKKTKAWNIWGSPFMLGLTCWLATTEAAAAATAACSWDCAMMCTIWSAKFVIFANAVKSFSSNEKFCHFLLLIWKIFESLKQYN